MRTDVALVKTIAPIKKFTFKRFFIIMCLIRNLFLFFLQGENGCKGWELS